MLSLIVILLLLAIAGVTYLLIRLTPASILEQPPPQPLSGFLSRVYGVAVRTRSFLNWAASTSLGFTLIAAFLVLGGVLIIVLVFSSP